MSTLRTFAPLLILIAILAVAGILFFKRMADFGKDIHAQTERST